MTTVERQGYCTLCRSRCGTLNVVRGDQLVEVRPDPSHPTGRAICMKGRAAPELVHSAHRLHTPLRRTRPKGEADPGWVAIGWDEALDEIATRLAAIRRDSGAEAVAFGISTPSGTALSDSIDWIERLVHLFGSPNVVSTTEICNWHKDVAHAFTFGCGMPAADYASTEVVLLWGHNPTSTWLAQAEAIARGRASGARLLVVDPRPTPLAQQADVWLRVRPGTDAALALGLANQLIERGAFDHDFVRDWTNAALLVRLDDGRLLRERDLDLALPASAGQRWMAWDAALGRAVPCDTRLAPQELQTKRFLLRGEVHADGRARGGESVACAPVFELFARAAAAWTPARVEAVTGVAQADLRAAAELLAGARRVAYHAWTGVGQHTNATQSERAIATLYALLGSFDVVGGNRILGRPAARNVVAADRLPPAQRAKALGLAQRPLGPPAQGKITARDFYRAVLHGEPYRVRAYVAFGTNPVVSQADTALAQQAMQALEFHVHCDLFETPTARYADILLPVASAWEREGLRIGFEIDERAAALVQLRPRMVPPQGLARADDEIVFALATRLGLAADFFDGSRETGWNHVLEPLGLTLDRLREHPQGVACPIDAAERKYARRAADGSVTGFGTPTRRVELYAEMLLQHGQPPLPTYLEPAAPPAGIRENFPLVLSSAKNGLYCHSQHRGLASLRRRAPWPLAQIGAGLAAARGIVDGERITVRSPLGEVPFVVRVTPRLADDVVIAEYGWWQSCPELGLVESAGAAPAAAPGGQFNRLISAEAHDPVSGSVAHRSFVCDIERDRSVAPRQRPWAGWRVFRIAARDVLAPGVLGLRLEAQDGGELPDHLPGQHVQLRLSIDGRPVVRAYSLIGPAVVPQRSGYRIAVRHQAADGGAGEGRMSAHLHRASKVGDAIELKAPAGSFTLPTRGRQPVVLVAGGIGITPFLSLLESLAGDLDMPEVWLYCSFRRPDAHPFRARILALAPLLPRLHVFEHYSEGAAGADGSRHLQPDAIAQELIARRARFYLCGPQPMVHAFTHGLVRRGVPAFDVFTEVFRSPADVSATLEGEPCEVRFARSGGKALRWAPGGGTLLELGESAGIAMPSGCRVGQCESCAVRVLSGRVAHLHGAEPDDATTCLACQAIPVGDVTLDA